jgi:hypothetical protein
MSARIILILGLGAVIEALFGAAFSRSAEACCPSSLQQNYTLVGFSPKLGVYASRRDNVCSACDTAEASWELLDRAFHPAARFDEPEPGSPAMSSVVTAPSPLKPVLEEALGAISPTLAARSPRAAARSARRDETGEIAAVIARELAVEGLAMSTSCPFKVRSRGKQVELIWVDPKTRKPRIAASLPI